MAETTTLKRGAKRTVLLVREGGDARVAKRFHDAGLLGYARDFWRARGELRVLRTLRERGVAVPRALGLRRVEGAWQVEMEAVEGAQSLDALLDYRERSPVPIALLARRLGELVARLQASGVDCPDLHAGNVLVDREGRLWLVDFHHARLRRLGPAALVDRLLSLLGQARERFTPRERARMALAWRRALPAELRSALPDPRTDGAELEAAARIRRREEVLRESRRWLRETSRGRIVEEAGLRFLEPEPIEAARRARLVAWVRKNLASPHGQASRILEEAGERALLVTAGSHDVLERDWRELGRLVLHRVPCARPLLLARRGTPWAVYDLPPSGERPGLAEDGAVRALVVRAGDRGLVPAEPIAVDGDGDRAWFAPGTRLVETARASERPDGPPAREPAR